MPWAVADPELRAKDATVAKNRGIELRECVITGSLRHPPPRIRRHTRTTRPVVANLGCPSSGNATGRGVVCPARETGSEPRKVNFPSLDDRDMFNWISPSFRLHRRYGSDSCTLLGNGAVWLRPRRF